MSGVNWGIITNQPSGGGGDVSTTFINAFDRQQQRDEQRRQFDLNYDLQLQSKDLQERQFKRQGEQWNQDFGLRKGADQRQAETHKFDMGDRQAKLDERAYGVFADLYDAASQAQTQEERNRLLGAVKKMVPGFDATAWMTEDGWNFGLQRLKKITESQARARDKQVADTDKVKSEAEENRAKSVYMGKQGDALDQHWVESPTNPGMLYNRKTGDTKPMAGAGNGNKALFDRKFATDEAPKLFAKASDSYLLSADTYKTTEDLLALAPHIYSGSWAGIQTEAAKIANKYLGANFQSVAPTELFHSLAQKFVGAEGQKYKPLSNSDVAFIEKALPTLGKDPSSLPHILGAMQRIASRDMLAHQMLMESYKNGVAPDMVALKQKLDAQVPSYVDETFGRARQPQQQGQQPGPAQMGPPAPAAPAAPAQQPAAPQTRALAPGAVIPHGQAVPPNTTVDWSPQGWVVKGASGQRQNATGFRAGPDVITAQDEQLAADQMPFYDTRKIMHNLRRGPGVF